MRILVIDDDVQAIAWLRSCAPTVLDGTNEIAFARDDAQALACLNDEIAFDLALVSVDNENHSGLAIFEQLTESSVRIPRIALTRGGHVATIKHALATGAADFLVKPFDLADFADTVRRVMAQVEQRRRNWREHGAYAALRRDVDIAADMQRRILPQHFPCDQLVDVAALMRPARGVGGDFYDVFRIDDSHVAVLIADVSGKGIPAAFYMAVASTTLRAVGMRNKAPGACLNETNNYLYERDIPGMFVSVFYAVINTDSGHVCCANAGHSPPLLSRTSDAVVSAFNSDGGPILGILADQRYAESEFSLLPGDSLLLYTDGISEARDADRVEFGESRLRNLMLKNLHCDSQAQIETLEQSLQEFTHGAEQHDDITAMVVRRSA